MSASPARSVALAHEANPPGGAILLVESNLAIGGELVGQLRADRYQAVHARTAEHARVLASARAIRAIVLGALDAPRAALDLLEEIRRPSATAEHGRYEWDERLPAIVVATCATQLDLIRAFEMGADDFIAHPARYLELRARLRALLRRVESDMPRQLLRVGSLEIDTAAHLVRFEGAVVELRRLEYELLVHLARTPTAVCSKQELLSAIWGRRSGSGTRTLDSHASRLRRKLDTAGANGLVVNVWGVGYRLL